MSDRVEFTRKVQAQIILRATNERGLILCEGVNEEGVVCGCFCKPGQFQIDHIIADGLKVVKPKLTAADGQLLCLPCHDEKTDKDKAAIARATRREQARLGAKKQPSRTIEGGPTFAPVDKSTKKSALKPVEKFAGLGLPSIARRFREAT